MFFFIYLGRRIGIEINLEDMVLESILHPPFIVWVKDKEIVIIGKQDLAPPVVEPQEVVRVPQGAQEVHENRWVHGVPGVPAHIVIIISIIQTIVQANP